MNLIVTHVPWFIDVISIVTERKPIKQQITGFFHFQIKFMLVGVWRQSFYGRAKSFAVDRFFEKNLLQTDDELLVSGRNAQKWRSPTSFHRQSVWKTTLVLKKIGARNSTWSTVEGESTEANYLSHSLYMRVCCVYNSKCYQRFNKI